MNLVKWSLDPTHSEVSFKVKHMMISTVTGHFKNFTLNVETLSDDFQTSKKIEFTADVDSIDTNNAQRDEHLKAADFFKAEESPKVIFSGSKYEGDGEEGKLYGDLTIAGITQPVTLNVEQGGLIKDLWGNERAGFTVNGKISRKDFGMLYNSALETGGVLVSDEVKISAEVQLIKEAVEVSA